MNIKVENNQATLCCGRKNKCPVVKEENGNIFISDDLGNTIKIEKEQALVISEAVKLITKWLRFAFLLVLA